jgi:hypothetical protein
MQSLISKTDIKSPHLVIIGAGASLAAFPHGDRNGKKLPLMNNFINIVDLQDDICDCDFLASETNIEIILAKLSELPEHTEILRKVQSKIYDYFLSLKITSKPTIYDYLILSLRDKDAIASFNWDPFLVQSYLRVQHITKKLPQLLFLHGTVALWHCESCGIVDLQRKFCRCGKKLKPMPLLYPTGNKDYLGTPTIKEYWNVVSKYLECANSITIFGYGAPDSDKDAIELFRKAWGDSEDRSMEQIEIINLEDRSHLIETWEQFIHGQHYEVHRDYFQSTIALFPRRVSEANFGRFNLNIWLTDHKIEKNLSFSELENKFHEIIVAE